ncbi:MAG: tetratricopeptide repeat protein [Thermoanaerobaculia bacterium]|jgi:TolA-binding protein
MDRQERHDIKHDRFVDEVSHYYDEVRKNSQRVMFGVVGLLVVIGIGIAIWGWSARQEKAAQKLLADAIETYDAPVGADVVADPNRKGPAFTTEAERTAAAEKKLTEVVSKYGRSDAAQVANLYLAQVDVSKGQTDAAIKRFEEFVKKNPDTLLAGGAQMSIFQLRLAADAKAVIPDLEKASQDEKSLLPKEAVLSLLAEAYEKSGDHAKSLDIYRRVATEFPQTAFAAQAQQKINRG